MTHKFISQFTDYNSQFCVNGTLWSCVGQQPVVIRPQAARWVFQGQLFMHKPPAYQSQLLAAPA